MESYEYGYLYLVGYYTGSSVGYHAVVITGDSTEATRIPAPQFTDRFIALMNEFGAAGWTISDLRPVTIADPERITSAIAAIDEGHKGLSSNQGFCCFMRRRTG